MLFAHWTFAQWALMMMTWGDGHCCLANDGEDWWRSREWVSQVRLKLYRFQSEEVISSIECCYVAMFSAIVQSAKSGLVYLPSKQGSGIAMPASVQWTCRGRKQHVVFIATRAGNGKWNVRRNISASLARRHSLQPLRHCWSRQAGLRKYVFICVGR
jgi:hypothetical protein